MSKVFYITRYPLLQNSNLKAKFDGQMKAWDKLGYDVYYLAYDDKHIYLIHRKIKRPIMRVFATSSGLFYHIIVYICLYISALRILRLMPWDQSDFAYIRSMPQEFFWRKMTKRMSKMSMKIVIEIPTYIREGGEKPRLYIRFFMWLLSPFSKDNKIDLYTLIGDKSDGFYRGKPAINIDNGVDSASIPERIIKSHEYINLLALGYMADWHGFDRVIEGLARYSQKEKVHFYIVGPDGDGSLKKWQQLAEKYKLLDIVHFTGPRFGEELFETINKCDVAFSSLGMYRKNCLYASDLKSREYMSRGMPFVYVVNDPVLDEYPSKYATKFPDDSSPIDIDKVVDFFHSFSPSNKMVQEMREYANKYMTWEKQFEKVINYFKDNSRYE